ncbi:tRNA (guanine(37)-N1)-methyltransferase [Neodiprion virginianus]|uniref:tRNA (guanine(37)-N1)-methyltransferase n=1 Tax=Neodiprion virginianus TaxID=2961670 RepID=UPI001EE72F3B|nr:tRNA (guanine(37)-N1)-methyltransferase [Neodiprion virginianus]
MAVVGYLVAALATCNRRGLSRHICNTVMASLLVPPTSVRGMTKLDRSKFTTIVELPVIRLGKANLARVMPALKKYMLKMQKFKPIQKYDDADDDGGKIAYLDPVKVQNFEDIDESDQKLLSDNDVTDFFKKRVSLNYDNWPYDQVLKAVFPEGAEVPNSYSKIGHLVHLNLRDSQLPQKHLIGQVLLDKISNTKTVVNKLNTIDTTYRHFAMEVLAGDKDTMVTVSEHGFQYKFDFATVYWNPRLATEHQALVSFIKPHDVLYDVFAGVGPFAIPAGCKGNRVMANDLNPESYRWLIENAKLNKTRGNVTAFNKDGREFLKVEVKNDILKRRDIGTEGSEHIAMNLPGMAVEFLDVFADWFNREEAEKVCRKPPIVHLYCFVKLGKDGDPHALAKLLVEEKLGHTLTPESLLTIHHVRNVSPNKEMMRVSFMLISDILIGYKPVAKKLKIDNTDLFLDENVIGKDGKEQGTPQDQKCVQGSRSS